MVKRKEPELIIEQLEGEEPMAEEAMYGNDADAGPYATEDGDGDGSDEDGGKKARHQKTKGPSALQQMKEQISEDDDAPSGSLTLRQIVGGDYLLTMVRNYVWLIMLVVALTIVYVAVRYQCQQDVIRISQMEKELTDAKYKAMASSTNLTEMCRQGNVLNVLRENNDTLLKMPTQPPFIVPVGESEE